MSVDQLRTHSTGVDVKNRKYSHMNHMVSLSTRPDVYKQGYHMLFINSCVQAEPPLS